MAGAIVMDNRTFKRGVDAMMKAYNTDAAGVMRRQMSIVSGQLAKRYPPLTASNKQSRKQGRIAIENDLSRIMIAIPKEHEPTLSRWQDSLEAYHDVFDDTGTRIQTWHEKHIDQRKKRVTRSITGHKFIAGRRFSEKLHVRERDLKKYVNRLYKNVGQLAGAWTAGTNLWKGGAKPASWLTRFSTNGRAIDRMGKNGSGYLEIQNHIQGSARWGRIDKFVMRSRERGFIKELKAAVRAADKAGNRIK